jgi:hypothetical protein
MPKGEAARPALYTITEGVMTADGGQGAELDEIFNRQYLANAPIRRLLTDMDLFWGISGVAVAAALVVLIVKLHNEDISWTIGRRPLTASVCSRIGGLNRPASPASISSPVRHGLDIHRRSACRYTTSIHIALILGPFDQNHCYTTLASTPRPRLGRHPEGSSLEYRSGWWVSGGCRASIYRD